MEEMVIRVALCFHSGEEVGGIKAGDCLHISRHGSILVVRHPPPTDGPEGDGFLEAKDFSTRPVRKELVLGFELTEEQIVALLRIISALTGCTFVSLSGNDTWMYFEVR